MEEYGPELLSKVIFVEGISRVTPLWSTLKRLNCTKGSQKLLSGQLWNSVRYRAYGGETYTTHGISLFFLRFIFLKYACVCVGGGFSASEYSAHGLGSLWTCSYSWLWVMGTKPTIFAREVWVHRNHISNPKWFLDALRNWSDLIISLFTPTDDQFPEYKELKLF